MAKFTRLITAMELRATVENRIRYSTKHIKHLPPGSITEFDWKDYCPVGFGYVRNNIVSCFKVKKRRELVFVMFFFVVVCRLIQELEGIDHDDYLLSICTDETLKKISSGKIGNVFHISNDNRFLIKILRKSEIKVPQNHLNTIYF